MKLPRPVLLAVVAVLALTAGLLTAHGWRQIQSPPAISGTLLPAPRPIPEFSLLTAAGQPFTNADLQGHWSVFFFGFTHCPDVCPMTMGDFKKIKAALGDDADRVNFLMISVDGERDTPEHLQRYISAFDPAFLGMTGSASDLRRIGADYGLYFNANKGEGENYTVDHTASIFMIDPEGYLRTIFTFGTEPDVITGYLRDLL